MVKEMGRRFDGARALVTGAGSGIGRATALRLAAEGARVVPLDARSDAVTAVIAELADAAGPGAVADVADETAVADAVDRATNELGGLDVVVCSAGIALNGSLHALDLADWRRVIDVNLTGTFLTIKHTLPVLRAESTSAIVTIGSVASAVAAGPVGSYDASKGGVLALTRAVAADYAEDGVRANCVCPGPVDTGLIANSALLTGRTDNSIRSRRVQAPLTRSADPDEIAAAVAFLCSSEAGYVTGSALFVDGGFTAV